MTSFIRTRKWVEMTPDEKGELLLAWHEGIDIEVSACAFHTYILVKNDGSKPFFFDNVYYRIAKKKPVSEIVTMYASSNMKGFGKTRGIKSRYQITFTKTNGVPDCDTVIMSEVK